MSHKENVYFYTSSHGKSTHYFPQNFNPLFRDSKRFNPPEIYAVGGRRMDQSVVDEVTYWAREFSPQKKQYIVLNFGDNNIRGQEHPSEILPFFTEIVSQLEEIPFVRLVLTSLVPNYGDDVTTKEDFICMDEMLKALALNSSKTRFCTFAGQLFQDGELYRGYFSRDKLHLSNDGARVIAQSIYQHLYRAPRIKN